MLVEDGQEVELDDYRREMRDRLADWVAPDKSRGRIGILAAPAGCGKTTAVDELAVPSWAAAPQEITSPLLNDAPVSVAAVEMELPLTTQL